MYTSKQGSRLICKAQAGIAAFGKEEILTNLVMWCTFNRLDLGSRRGGPNECLGLNNDFLFAI